MRQDVQVVQTMIDQMVGIQKYSYPARQNEAPRPSGEFCHVRLLEEYQIGIPYPDLVSETDTTQKFVSVSPVKLRFRVGVVGTDGTNPTRIMHGWVSHQMRQLMIDSGYGFIGISPLSNEDAKLEKYWEYRFGFALELYTTRIIEEVVPDEFSEDVIDSMVVPTRHITDYVDEYLTNYIINP